jgi:energy-coupling factor transport system ATP-binding protein
MIEVDRLSFSYPDCRTRALDGVTLSIRPGEFVLLVGASGSGKSTLLRCLNGLIPHFHGGDFSGRVVVDGRDTKHHQPRDLADTVGLVLQDPEAQIVAETVEDEITFGLDNLGLPASMVQKRLEETLDQLHIASLRRRRLDTLSGGELQRVAIASALATQPSVLLLDEPTSQLDPQSAEDLLSTVQRLNDDLGLTVVMAEHRLERVVQYVNRVIYLPGDGSTHSMDVRQAMTSLPLAPPVSRLGRALGWSPVPLSVKEGRRFAPTRRIDMDETPSNGLAGRSSVARARDLTVRLGGSVVIDRVSFDAYSGEILALMGRNGAGKTTLLRSLMSLVGIERGSIDIAGMDTGQTPTERLARTVAFVPQNPGAILYHRTVSEEIADTLDGTQRAGTVAEALIEWRLEDHKDSDPLDLSVGERQRTALAAMCAGDPSIILVDEPTRGMDYGTKELLVNNLRQRCREGACVVLASHDVELVASCADRVLLLADGQVVLERPVRTALTDTLTFSTQINKLFGGTLLTPEDVLSEMARG